MRISSFNTSCLSIFSTSSTTGMTSVSPSCRISGDWSKGLPTGIRSISTVSRARASFTTTSRSRVIADARTRLVASRRFEIESSSQQSGMTISRSSLVESRAIGPSAPVRSMQLLRFFVVVVCFVDAARGFGDVHVYRRSSNSRGEEFARRRRTHGSRLRCAPKKATTYCSRRISP